MWIYINLYQELLSAGAKIKNVTPSLIDRFLAEIPDEDFQKLISNSDDESDEKDDHINKLKDKLLDLVNLMLKQDITINDDSFKKLEVLLKDDKNEKVLLCKQLLQKGMSKQAPKVLSMLFKPDGSSAAASKDKDSNSKPDESAVAVSKNPDQAIGISRS